jgi:aldose sugar dehydrogenase
MNSTLRFFLALAVCCAALEVREPAAQSVLPTVTDPNLTVRPVISDLEQPIAMAFIGANEFLVLEKASGRVKHVINGALAQIVLDLAVNNSSERGLLSIALHPQFATNRFVYLYWTCSAPQGVSTFQPSAPTCPATPATGADSDQLVEVPLFGNRVDRFIWDGAVLRFDENLINLRAFQHDRTNNVPRGNHNGGVIRFGSDNKLYIVLGDVGRRGQMQNLVEGGKGEGESDDLFGGPGPDRAHFTGVVMRLNDDGTAPPDNPFFALGSGIGGDVGGNLQRLFAYGIRNGFGLAVDPVSGDLWYQDHGDDTFDELNRLTPGANLGWIQTMGPIARVGEFRAIELTLAPRDLQQARWSPNLIATTPEEAQSRLFMLHGAHYDDPEFSWRYAVAPGGIGFMRGDGLGAEYANDLFIAASRTTLQNGYLFRMDLSNDRRDVVAATDARLADRVADNHAKFDITESESFQFGSNFGIGTDVQTGPDGNLYVVSLSNGVIYEISRRR